MIKKIVISGASIAGLSAAYWLAKNKWDVTIIERSESFRDGGQNVDIRGVARDVIKKMGLYENAKKHNTNEDGTVIVDNKGKTIATLPSDDVDGATAELEILRGDLAKIILKALPKNVTIIYGKKIVSVDQTTNTVTINLDDNKSIKADLLIIAEGVRSSTRKLVFPNAETDELNITMAFGTIPRTKDDNNYWRWYNTVGGRQVHLRPDNYGTTRAILAYGKGKSLSGKNREEALKYLSNKFRDAGWQSDRVVKAFRESKDTYYDDLAQVKLPKWSDKNIVLLGDAAWCVTPIGGGGASLALTGGYVLAAYLSKYDTETALSKFERWMRPLVDNVQKLPPGIHATAYPQSYIGLTMRNILNKIIFSNALKPLSSKMTHVADTDQVLPKMA